MPANVIAAEVTATTQQEKNAASTLQRLGFRVHHIGQTISVDGPETLWTSTFGVKFETRKKSQGLGAKGSQIAFRQARPGSLHIPLDLQSLLVDVAFVEPPDFFSF